jgi:hypothetical protein
MSRGLDIGKLIQRIESAGGQFVLTPETRQVSLLWPATTLTPRKRAEFVVLQQKVGVEAYCTAAWLYERRASQRWDESKHDPGWWRNYDD